MDHIRNLSQISQEKIMDIKNKYNDTVFTISPQGNVDIMTPLLNYMKNSPEAVQVDILNTEGFNENIFLEIIKQGESETIEQVLNMVKNFDKENQKRTLSARDRKNKTFRIYFCQTHLINIILLE